MNAEDRPIGRRAFLGGLAVGAVPLACAGGLDAAGPAGSPPPSGPAAFPGLITREKAPLNLEFPFPTLSGPITPVNQFFMRTHFAIPALTAGSWRLTVDGEVERE